MISKCNFEQLNQFPSNAQKKHAKSSKRKGFWVSFPRKILFSVINSLCQKVALFLLSNLLNLSELFNGAEDLKGPSLKIIQPLAFEDGPFERAITLRSNAGKHVGETYTEPPIVTDNTCRFRQCTFYKITFDGILFDLDNANFHFSFVSCMFLQINNNDFVLYVSKAVMEVQDRCCFSGGTNRHIYGSNEGVGSESVNSTVCSNSKARAPFLGCSTELTNFFNNHSYLYKGDAVDCFYLYDTPSKEDNNCFFIGSSCIGKHHVDHNSNTDGCVLTKFNFVNNSGSVGYFYLGYNNHKRIKDSVIEFKSTEPRKWFHPASYSSATLSLEGCHVIAQGAIETDGRITLAAGTITTSRSTSTHTPFHPHMDRNNCWYFSRDFSNSPQTSSNLATLLSHAALSLASTIILVL